MNIKLPVVLSALLLLAGCAGIQVTPAGTYFDPPHLSAGKVAVFGRILYEENGGKPNMATLFLTTSKGRNTEIAGLSMTDTSAPVTVDRQGYFLSVLPRGTYWLHSYASSGARDWAFEILTQVSLDVSLSPEAAQTTLLYVGDLEISSDVNIETHLLSDDIESASIREIRVVDGLHDARQALEKKALWSRAWPVETRLMTVHDDIPPRMVKNHVSEGFAIPAFFHAK